MMNDSTILVLRRALEAGRDDLEAARLKVGKLNQELAMAENRVEACEKYVAELAEAIGDES